MEKAWTGTLTDTDIKAYVEKKVLIIENFEVGCVHQACYELRASNTYYDLTSSDRPQKIDSSGYILLKPQQIVVIITHEKLKLPSDILGRVLTKGSLFSLGVIPVNTYADPGFYGKLGIVFQNTSNYYIKIKELQCIAKMEFSKLHNVVEEPYHGQHGYGTEIWPVAKQYILTDDEIKNDSRIYKDDVKEIGESYGDLIGNLLKRVFVVERRLLITSILYFTFNFILIGILLYNGKEPTDYFSPLVNVIIGLGSNILFAIISGMFFYKRKR